MKSNQNPEGKTRKAVFQLIQRITGDPLIWLRHCTHLLTSDYFGLFIKETHEGGIIAVQLPTQFGAT